MSINLDSLQQAINGLLLNEVKEIVFQVRNSSINNVIEKTDGDSATLADLAISELLLVKLTELVPNSLIIEEESFNKSSYEKLNKYQYVWIVDPIDGTKAFRTMGNYEYCVAIALLKKGKPILSSVYAPELLIDGKPGAIFEAHDDREGAFINGKQISCRLELVDFKDVKCVNHIHRDIELNNLENALSSLFIKKEMIRAFEGHSTILHYLMVVYEKEPQIFTRRHANVWDVIQAAYIIKKAGGIVMYPNGNSIFPLHSDLLVFEEANKLIIPFNIACTLVEKEKILASLSNI